MGASTSNAANTQITGDISNLKTSISSLKTKVDNFQAASVDYTQLSSGIVNTSDNLKKVTDAIIAQPTKLSDAIVPGIISNTSFSTAINQSITQNQDFTKNVANKITSDPSLKAILKGDKGEPGSIGDLTSLRSNLFTNKLGDAKNAVTMWCADGDLCKLPAGNKGIDWGYGGSKIYDDGQLRVISDDNIFLRVGDKSQKGLHINQSGIGGAVFGDEEHGDFTGINSKRRDGRWTIFDWKDDQKNYIRGDTIFDDNVKVNMLNSRGFTGPFLVHSYDNGDKCWDVGQNGGLGIIDCNNGNKFQRFWFSPVTGQLYNEQLNKCLDVGNNSWNWLDCNNHQNQQFWRKEHLIQWRNQDCIDIGNGNHHSGCDGGNNNQKMRWEYVG